MKQKITSNYGYHKYYKLPEKFEKVNKRKNKLYKEWREKKNKLLNLRIEFIECELWQKFLNDKEQKDMIKKYKTANIAKKRYWRWMEPIGYKTTTTKNISILEKKFKASK